MADPESIAETTPAGSFMIAADHPCLDGHFPGNPLVPGVILLDSALAQIGAQIGARIGAPVGRLTSLASAKFHAPVRPGQRVDVTYSLQGGRVAFACKVDGHPAATATASFAPPE